MKGGYKAMRVGVNTYPHALACLDNKLKSIADNMLPTTTGFEFETNAMTNAGYYEVSERMKCIDGIKYVQNDNEEFRFTIPRGINGMVCLDKTLEIYKQLLFKNTGSGIHIHVFILPKYRNKLETYLNFLKNNEYDNFILRWLDKYKYRGSFNSREIGTSSSSHRWVRMNNNLTTLEFRIFEMTFEYEELIKIVLDLHNLMKEIYSVLEEIELRHTGNVSYNIKPHIKGEFSAKQQVKALRDYKTNRAIRLSKEIKKKELKLKLPAL
jgi:hypothetical protein